MLGKVHQARLRPTALGLLAQSSTYGATIPRIYGMTRSSLLAIWANNLRKGSSVKKFKGKKGGTPTYIGNFDFLLGSNPIVNVLRMWGNNTEYNMTFRKHTTTIPSGGVIDVGAVDSTLFQIIAVTLTAAYSASFADFGGQAASLSGNYEIPLWNAAFSGPDPVNASVYRLWPYFYYSAPGSGVVKIDAAGFGGGPLSVGATINIYYAGIQTVYSSLSPLAQLRFTFENQLGNGPEYSGFSAQQIIYPQYAGQGSPNLDLGSAQILQAYKSEVLGSYGVYSSGDADFVDMVEDIIKMGISQADPSGTTAFGPVQFGLSCFDYPGMVQKKALSSTSGITSVTYDLPNTAGNFLFVFIDRPGNNAATFAISDTAGNSWTPIFPANSIRQGWYATAVAFGPRNVVTVSSTGASPTDVQAFEFAGLDTIDQVVVATGAGATASASITTTNEGGQPEFLFGWAFAATTDSFTANQFVASWTALLTGVVPAGQGSASAEIAYWRLIKTSGTYTLSIPLNDTAQPWAMVLIGIKNTQAVSFPKPLGDILDDASMQLVRKQCRAYGLIGALSMDSQKKGVDWLDELYIAMNAAAVWSGFRLKSFPWSEASFAGNGAIYTAPTASGPIADLLESDFLGSSKNPILTIERKAVQAEVENIAQIQHISRGDLGYAAGTGGKIPAYLQITTAQPDQATVALYGPRKMPHKVMNCIQDVSVARMIAGIMVRRLVNIRNLYKGKLGPRWKLLEPMDLVTISEPKLGIVKKPVRVVSIDEDEKYNLDVTFEDFIYGVHAPVSLAVVENQSIPPPTNAPPGNINPPIIFLAIPRLNSGQAGQYLWMALSGADSNWGGCLIYGSSDGTTYSVIGEQIGQSTMGPTSGDFPAAADPDTADDLLVDLTESFGTLSNFSVVDEDNFLSLIYLSGGDSCIVYELLSYAVANLTAPNQYTISGTGGNKIRRGVFATPIAAHSRGTDFAYFGPGAIFTKLLVDPTWIGKTVFFKFPSFNTFGAALQSLADVPAYPFTIPTPCSSAVGLPPPDKVINISSTVVGNFTIAHGMGTTPQFAAVQMTAAGKIRFQPTRYNATNVNLSASGAGLTGRLLLWSIAPTLEVALAPSGPGNFDVAHSLGSIPAVLNIQMTADGVIWGQPVPDDASALHLVASGAGALSGYAQLWNPSAAPTAVSRVEVALNPTAPGNFTVPHGLGKIPSFVLPPLMTAGGEIWFQSIFYDATNLYLVASDANLTGVIEVFG